MADNETKEIQVRPKQEVSSPTEQTKSGLVFTPDVDIFETETQITVLADMPGVTTQGLMIDLRDNTLTLQGDAPQQGGDHEHFIVSEYGTGRFYRQFTLSEVIDQSGISASLKNGVLRLDLPKVAKATPRKIEVQAG